MQTNASNDSLPKYCFSILPSSGELITIEKDVNGYRPVADTWVTCYMKQHPCDSQDELADLLNKGDGVTKAEREAMTWGSMFGWDSPLADPARYDANGKVLRRQAQEVQYA